MNKMMIGSIVFAGMAAAIGLSAVWYAKGEEGMSFSIGIGKADVSNIQEFPADKIENLVIEYSSENLYLYEGEGDKIVIKEYLKGNGKSEMQVNGDTLSIIEADRGIRISFFVFSEEKVEIFLPKGYKGSVKTAVSSGNVRAECALELKEFAVSSKSGNISCGEIGAEEVKAMTNSGNIIFKKAQGNRKIETKSGNIKLEGGEGNTWVSSKSGNISVENADGGFSGIAQSGNITAGFVCVKGDITAETSSGNIRLELPEESEFDYEGYASSGTIKTDFNEMLSFNEKRNEAKGSYGSTPGMRVRTKASSGNTHIVLK